jgi:branched-chain amino acid transport system ATP-binding protein
MSFFTVDSISLQFGGLKAVDNVSFSVTKGEIFTIIGPNGAGKTSIFNLISRLYDPTSGKLFFEGTDITEVPPHRIA